MKDYNGAVESGRYIAENQNCIVVVVPYLDASPLDAVSAAFGGPYASGTIQKESTERLATVLYQANNIASGVYKDVNIVYVTTSGGAQITESTVQYMKSDLLLSKLKNIPIQTLGRAGSQFEKFFKMERHDVFDTWYYEKESRWITGDIIPQPSSWFTGGLNRPDIIHHNSFLDFPDCHNIENGYVKLIDPTFGGNK
jgi:hypothetical protein